MGGGSGRLFYGWYIAAAGAGTNCVVLGITQFGIGVFIEAFHTTFGWSVTAIALGYSIRILEQGLFASFTGYIADRVGPRRMGVIGVTVIALSLLLFSQATTLPIYYAASVVMALGQSIGGANAFTLAIMRWFVRRRGNAMSIIATGSRAKVQSASGSGVREAIRTPAFYFLVLAMPWWPTPWTSGSRRRQPTASP